MNELKNEVWKDVQGWFGHIKVSNYGRVMTRGFMKRAGEWRLRTIRQDQKGYCILFISCLDEKKVLKVHRLVAEAFLPNPDHLPHVNHKDENKANNSVDNLEWCDNDYNNHYGTKQSRVSDKMKMMQNEKRKELRAKFPYAVKKHGLIDWGKVLETEFNGDEKSFRKFLKANSYSINGITKIMKTISEAKSKAV